MKLAFVLNKLSGASAQIPTTVGWKLWTYYTLTTIFLKITSNSVDNLQMIPLNCKRYVFQIFYNLFCSLLRMEMCAFRSCILLSMTLRVGSFPRKGGTPPRTSGELLHTERTWIYSASWLFFRVNCYWQLMHTYIVEYSIPLFSLISNKYHQKKS